MSYLALAKKAEERLKQHGGVQIYTVPSLRAWVVEEVRGENGELRAALICSAILQDHLWVICDRSFEPKDGLAVYYGEELPLLRSKTPEELREIHKVKITFPGSRIIQEGAE